jgi:hypothetical protein
MRVGMDGFSSEGANVDVKIPSLLILAWPRKTWFRDPIGDDGA